MDGLLIIDKPAGLTSHDVVARVRKLLRERRVGHTGTLDPFATGVLVVMVGRATRLAQFLSGAEKEYEGIVRLGYATDTGDLTGKRRAGEIKDVENMGLKDDEIQTAIESLRGEIKQVPPMYSAKKVGGQKLYEMARKGVEIKRKAVRVHISEFEAKRQDGSLLKHNEDGTSDLRVRVVCSAGTYVRSLAESVGESLGVGAHLASLRRTRAGAFRIEDAITLEELEEFARRDEILTVMLRPGAALSDLPFLHLTDEEARRAFNGQSVEASQGVEEKWPDGQNIRMQDERGNLIAVGVYRTDRHDVQPRVRVAHEK